MYKGIVNSPMTELVNDIDTVQTTIEIMDGNALPNAPNIATIGIGEDAETILYGSKNGTTLSDVTRGFQGIAKAWDKGIAIARMFTAYDYEALIENIESVDEKADGTIKESEKGKIGGVAKQDDFVEHLDDEVKHITSAERTKWDGKQDKLTISSEVNSTSTTQVANSNAVKQAYDRADAAFTLADNGKTSIKDAIIGVDDSVVIPTDPSFIDLVDAINSIETDFIVTPGERVAAEKTSDFIRPSNQNTWGKVSEMKFPYKGKIRVSFTIRAYSTTSWHEGRIYVNGVARTPIRKVDRGVFMTFTEDVDVNINDSIQLYSRWDNGQPYYESFIIKTDNLRFPEIIL